jgi:hypothetical protein
MEPRAYLWNYAAALHTESPQDQSGCEWLLSLVAHEHLFQIIDCASIDLPVPCSLRAQLEKFYVCITLTSFEMFEARNCRGKILPFTSTTSTASSG